MDATNLLVNRNGTFGKRFLYLLLFALFLTPSIRIISSMPAVRLDDLLAFFFLLIMIFSKQMPWSRQQTLLLLFILFILVSIFVGSEKGYDASFGDFNQITRILKYVAVISIVLAYLRENVFSVQSKKNILNLIVVLGVVLSFLVIQQYFDVMRLNELYVKYVAPTQFQTLVDGFSSPRPVGMVGNPNEVSYLLSISAISSMFLIVYYGFNVKLCVSFVLNISAVVLTQSRTGLIFLLVSFLFLMLNALRDRRIKFSLLFVILLIGFTGYLVLNNQTIYDKVFWRFGEAIDLSSSVSWVQRLNDWGENYTLFMDSPIFGVGPLRTVQFQFAADNEWLLLLRSYGVVGCVYFLIMFIVPVWGRATKIDMEHKSFLRLYTSLLMGSVFYMIPAVIFHSLTLMPVLLVISALSLHGPQKKEKKQSWENNSIFR